MKTILVTDSDDRTHLSLKLMDLARGHGRDIDDEADEKVAPFVTDSRIGDCQDEEVLQELGVGNFDLCFVCISNDFQGCLEVTYLLKELGARYVVSRADRESQTKFLQKIGADEVIHPEKDMAQRTAVKFSARNSFDYIEMSPDYAICELKVPKLDRQNRSGDRCALKT
jgi:trk system potassium uptake protein TrkA